MTINRHDSTDICVENRGVNFSCYERAGIAFTKFVDEHHDTKVTSKCARMNVQECDMHAKFRPSGFREDFVLFECSDQCAINMTS